MGLKPRVESTGTGKYRNAQVKAFTHEDKNFAKLRPACNYMQKWRTIC